MTATRQLRRLGADVAGVVRCVDVASTARWLMGAATHAPQIARSRSLGAADARAGRHESSFRTPTGQRVILPTGAFGSGRELYVRNVYLRGGATVREGDTVVDLGANAGVFSVLAAVLGARVVGVEAQVGFEPEFRSLAARNRVSDRMAFCAAMIGPADAAVGHIGKLNDDEIWEHASHATEERTPNLSMPDLMERYSMNRIDLLKVDIEGGEFGVFDPADDLGWVDRVGTITMEVHPEFGDVASLQSVLERCGFICDTTDNDGVSRPAADPSIQYLYANRSV